MKLIPVYEHPGAANILWDIMAEVQPHQAISHKAGTMPAWEDHLRFVYWDAPRLYEAWYLIDLEGVIIGWIQLTLRNEIGIRIANLHQGKGFGPEAIKRLMGKHGPRRWIANINPANEPSRKMFGKLGFKHIQNTYALEAK